MVIRHGQQAYKWLLFIVLSTMPNPLSRLLFSCGQMATEGLLVGRKNHRVRRDLRGHLGSNLGSNWREEVELSGHRSPVRDFRGCSWRGQGIMMWWHHTKMMLSYQGHSPSECCTCPPPMVILSLPEKVSTERTWGGCYMHLPCKWEFHYLQGKCVQSLSEAATELPFPGSDDFMVFQEPLKSEETLPPNWTLSSLRWNITLLLALRSTGIVS